MRTPLESYILKSTLHEADKTPTTPSKGTNMVAVVDGAMGKYVVTVHPAWGYTCLFFNNYAGCGMAPSDKEELPKPEAMDTSTHSGRDWVDIVSDEKFPPWQPTVEPWADLSNLEYLDDNHHQGIVPKGLRLERKFTRVIVDGFTTVIQSQIEDVLSTYT